jgi:hypothetical protein
MNSTPAGAGDHQGVELVIDTELIDISSLRGAGMAVCRAQSSTTVVRHGGVSGT